MEPQESATPVFIPMSSRARDNSAVPSPLFVACAPALLPPPNSTPPRPPKTRRKTLAGVMGFNLARTSPRLQPNKRTVPVAEMAERILFQCMGIIDKGQ
ncbi:hypothetical protein ZWY2020_054883 [Hordeum vulgare]|nr:hypothetical protein ZWY2020_054883 [Hordeum vulgare]